MLGWGETIRWGNIFEKKNNQSLLYLQNMANSEKGMKTINLFSF